MPAIDILMPMRDSSAWVGAAWQSLERQSFRDWRLIAVDDGSRDETVGVLAEAARGDPRLEILQAPRAGVASALNRGLRSVTAPIVARMDADDLAHPDRLAVLWDAFEARPELSVVSSRVRLFPRAAIAPAMDAYIRWQNELLTPREIWLERYVECTVTHAATAFRTGVLWDVGGWWQGEGPEDLDLFLRLHASGARFEKLPRVLYLWRERPDRETRSSPRLRTDAFRETKARHLAAELAARGVGEVTLFGVGESLACWVEALRSRGVPVEGVEHRPGRRPPQAPGLRLFCFGSARARARVRQSLADSEEGEDYLFVA